MKQREEELTPWRPGCIITPEGVAISSHMLGMYSVNTPEEALKGIAKVIEISDIAIAIATTPDEFNKGEAE